MAETWFRTGGFRQAIEPVKVLKATEKTVEVEREWNGRVTTSRSHKRSTYDNYFPTWEEAHAFLLEKAETRLEGARVGLQKAQNEYFIVKGMKKPEGA